MMLSVDRFSRTPLYLQLYRALRDRILEGSLPPGYRMPASRRLAEELQIARNVVIQAYDQLIAVGYLVGRHGSGTYVAHWLPDGLRPADPVTTDLPPVVGAASPPASASSPGVPLTYDFRTGIPDVASFPRTVWGRLLTRSLQTLPDKCLGYGPVSGSPTLRRLMVGHLGRTRGIRTQPGHVVVTTGSTQALAVLAEVLLRPGDVVAVENPSHTAARQIFARRGARLLPMPVDEEGIRVTDLAASGIAPRIIYVTPSHQFPWGCAMSLRRRAALIELAQRTDAIIIEDDYDSEIRHTGSPLPALQGLAPGSVAYVGSFSKLLAPTLRLGYAVLPPGLVPPFVRHKQLVDYHTPGIEQEALSAFIADGHLDRHLHRVRRVYHKRRRALVDALARGFGNRAGVHGDETGLHLRVELTCPLPGRIVADAARRAGVGIYPLEDYWEGDGLPPGCHLFLGYGSLDEEGIRVGIRLLAEAVNRLATSACL